MSTVTETHQGALGELPDPTAICLQHLVIQALEYGLASKQACTCLRALVLATLEIRSAMGKLLPEVLQRLAQVSATLAVAVPVLEFLSSEYRFLMHCFSCRPISLEVLISFTRSAVFWCYPKHNYSDIFKNN